MLKTLCDLQDELYTLLGRLEELSELTENIIKDINNKLIQYTYSDDYPITQYNIHIQLKDGSIHVGRPVEGGYLTINNETSMVSFHNKDEVKCLDE